ncbi:MAG: sugar phosphate isomerase/epimerase family protein [Ferruginibacter sp.]
MKYTRNKFLKLTALAIPGAATAAVTSSFTQAPTKDDAALNLAVASYTFRKFNLDNTIRMSKRLGINDISLKDFHMPLNSSAAEIKAIAQKVKDAGMNLYGAGVIYMKTPEEVNSIFDYAANAGLNMIIGVPNHELLAMVNEKVQSTNIRLAIHNHGPGDKLYTSPDNVYENIKDLDKRIGFCIDIGHVQRIGQDPCTMLEKYKDRLFDMHMKDVSSSTADGSPVEIGHGVINIPKVIKTLKKIKYKGHVCFEYEKDGEDPLAGFAESVGYVRGVMKVV